MFKDLHIGIIVFFDIFINHVKIIQNVFQVPMGFFFNLLFLFNIGERSFALLSLET